MVKETEQIASNTNVSLFISCIVDSFFPQVGQSMVKVLRRAGVQNITFPENQTCCGQPAFNSGFEDEARAVAAQVRATILGELGRITGENHADAPTWRKWWRDHRAGFKFG